MGLLVAGLVLFLGVHSARIAVDGWRTSMVGRFGEGAWKGVYSLLAIAGFALIVWGYGLARQDPTVLWPAPPVGVRHLASLLTLLAFVLLAAAYVPNNRIRGRLHHPMVLAVILWSVAHLAANNTLADLVLFGSFLLWAVLDLLAARRRDVATNTVYFRGLWSRAAIATVVGIAAWVAFAFWLHPWWIGVRPF